MNEELLSKLTNFSVLYLEDEDGLRERVINTLKYYFREVYGAKTSSQALEQFNSNDIDLILSDIELDNQKQNGIDFVRKIREINKDIPIVIVTAYTTEKYLLDLINLKIDFYLKKPITFEKLYAAIEIALKPKLKNIFKITDNLFFEIISEELFFQNQIIKLTKREKQFLTLLIKNKNQTTTYSQIEYELWGDDFMSESALKSFIKELRKKVPVEFLQNISKEGYKLIL